MAQMTVTVNGQSYALACDDGEESHLAELARLVDARVADVRRDVKSASEPHLLLMAGLLLADELALARERIQDLEETMAGLKGEFLETEPPKASAEARHDPDQLAALLENAARRMEDIAARLR